MAVYAGDYSAFTLTNISALGGPAIVSGGAGTVFIKDTDEVTGTLVIDGATSGTGFTPLGLPGSDSFTSADALLIRGANTRVQPDHAGMTFGFASMTVESSAVVNLDGDLNVSGSLTVTGSGRLEIFGQLTAQGAVQVDGGTLSGGHLVAPTLSVSNSGVVTSPVATASRTHKLELSVAGTLSVDATSRIDVSGKGYLPGRTSGNTTVGGAKNISGGSYGGLGGLWTGGGGDVVPAVYGDYADPDDWGSGAGNNTTMSGGGLVRLTVGTLALEGQILANGLIAGATGGGAGGGIYVAVQTLQGGGSIRAHGGGLGFSQTYGGGGGGRVAVYAGDYSAFTLTNISALGGPAIVSGGAGTVYVRQHRAPTRARVFAPVTSNGNYIRQLESVALKFTRPINVASLNASSFQMVGPLGPVATNTATELSPLIYEITFPLQTADGTYRFILAPTVLDAEGFQMDQNANGIPGEADDGYSFTLILDTVPPRLTQHSPAGDIAGTATTVDVWFSEAIDKTTFTTADVSIRNPSNGNVPVSSIAEVGLNRFRITFPAQTATGTYHVRIGPNVSDLAGNLLDQDRDGSAGEPTDDVYDALFNLVPVDLQLSNVSPTANQFTAGDSYGVSWKGRNTTGAPLIGNWIDAVYLSPDPFWNITDTLVATVQHSGGLTANEVYSASAGFNVPGVLPGNYYLLIRADIGNETRETLETNNLVSFGPIPVTVRQVAIGGSATGALTAGNRSHYFAVTVAGGESLRLTLNGPTSVNQLSVNFASIPTVLSPDFSGTTTGTGQTVTLTGGPSGGTYYVLVSGEQVGGSSSYTLTADSAPFFITGLTPASAGNLSAFDSFQPPTTVTITGAGFDAATTVEFIGSGGQVRLPERTNLVSSALLTLQLNTLSWTLGTYDVRVTKGGISRLLSGAFAVQAGDSRFRASLVVPSALSPGYPTRQTIWIEYENAGNASMFAPTLQITASSNAVLTDDPVVAISARASSAEAAQLTNSLQVLALGSGATPGILQAGDRGRIPIYYLGLRPDSGVGQISVQLGSAKALDIEWVPNAAGAAPSAGFAAAVAGGAAVAASIPQPKIRSLNWSAAAAERSRPETIAPEAWSAVWANLRNQLGIEWFNYQSKLAAQATYLASIGQRTTSVSKLFNFAVLQATGGLHPVGTLAGAVDASVPSPGFPLVFRRVYGQSMVSRYKLGPLGRGWTHNWAISIQELQKTAGVVVHGPNGADRFFSRNSNGTYTAAAGDTGKLTLTGTFFKLTEADGTVWQFKLQGANSVLDYVQDPNGNRITCGYSGALLTSLAHSSGKQILLAYNGAGRIASLTDPVGPGAVDDRVTIYEYDGSGEHLIRVTAPGSRVTTYSYQTTGAAPGLHALTGVTHPDFTDDAFAYDALGRLTQSFSSCCGGAQTVSYSFDSAGAVTVTDATNRITQLFYGLGGQLAQVRDGEGRTVNFGYNDNSQLTRLLGPGGERYGYGYDGLGNLTGLEDPLRQGSAFAYEPSFNRLAQVRDARGNGLRYTYDTRGNLTAITYADNTSERFTYDARGKVSTSTNRRGGVINYAYNAAGQLTSKDYAATAGITEFAYAYDPAGNLTGATSWNPQLAAYETINLQYESFTDRLTRIEYPGGKFFTFAYNAAGRRTRRTDQDGNITNYLYDALGRLDRMTDGPGSTVVDYDYDAAGRLSRKTLGNGVFTTYTYNDAGQVTLLVNSRADNTVLSRFAYTYDASGRRDSMTTLEGTFTYGYDPLGQLTRVAHPDGHVVAYSYDAAGNRISVADNGTVTPYAANTLNQYSSAGAASFGYDPDGNLTNKTEAATATTYTYDLENHLTGVATPPDNWTYTYDAFGNRVATTHNGQTTRYVIDPDGLGNVAAEYDGGGSLIARYEHGFGLLARNDPAGNPAYYTFSAIGHTSELTNSTGAVANSYSYDPFGVSLAKIETIPNPFEYVGELGVMNEANGLEFMRARHYSASLGNFLQTDPIGIEGGTNLYGYAVNDPVFNADPTGLVCLFRVPPGARTPVLPSLPGVPAAPGAGRAFGPCTLTDTRIINGNKTCIYTCQGTAQSHSRVIPKDKDCVEDFPDGWIPPTPAKMAPGPVPVPVPEPTDPNKEDEKFPPVPRSRDPNDKLAPVGYGSAGFIPAGGVMPYQIRFENQSSASAPAQRVTVTDTLGANFDLNTFEFTEIAFADQVIPIPAGLNRYEARVPLTIANAFATASLVVDVKAALDVPTRTVTLTLTALDPETGWTPENPFAGLLYPNDATHRGEGSISFRVKANGGLPTGNSFVNGASIVFDTNDPIQTPIVRNTLDAAAPSSRVTMLPVSSNSQTLLVQWTGQDDTNGAGIDSFDIYAAINGGPWTLWQNRTTDLSAAFVGGFGYTYRFYSVARDNAGNTEAAPDTADTTVRVNHDPVAGADSLGTDQERPASVAVRKLLLNDRDEDGDPLTLTLAGTLSIQSGSLALANGLLTYTPPTGFSGADSFTYTLSDGLGGIGLGTVIVTVRPTWPPANAIRLTPLPNGSMRLNMVGIPGRSYVIQVSTDLAAWATLATMVAGPNGEFQYEDVDAVSLGQRFYRLALP